MKSLIATLALSLTFAARLLAQESTAHYDSPQHELTVHSSMPTPLAYGAPPPFADLARDGGRAISASEADAYPPLANDFLRADSNRDGRISRAEYERWVKTQ